MKVGVVDIETSGLDADMGRVFCAVVKTYGTDEIRIFRGDKYRSWWTNRDDDSELVDEILSYLSDFDILVGHNLQWFDRPFLVTRALLTGKPIIQSKMVIDTVKLARKHLRLKYNSLDSVAKHLNVADEKTPLSKKLWRKVIFNGDQEALSDVVHHCVMDVKVNEQVLTVLRQFVTKIDAWGSA